MCNIPRLQIVGLGCETQLQVGNNLNIVDLVIFENFRFWDISRSLEFASLFL